MVERVVGKNKALQLTANRAERLGEKMMSRILNELKRGDQQASTLGSQKGMEQEDTAIEVRGGKKQKECKVRFRSLSVENASIPRCFHSIPFQECFHSIPMLPRR